MVNELIQWILSKLIPYRAIEDSIVSDRNWDKRKLEENEQFYGGQDGTRKC
jgi:hypothetical protein